jgi:hypothetical protein
MYKRYKGYLEKLTKKTTINKVNIKIPKKITNIKKTNRLGLVERAYLRNILFVTGTKHQDVAEKLGLSNAMVTMVLRGQRYSKKVVDYIYNLEQNDPAIEKIFN